ncbi:hypothetical protein M413DRAFT_20923 [Hebeloma cylindrosporum]|uniref:Uncharacterized protein n=1 Tax=Hebeloma cylindrosporum TaxID=76867 RepID=A0A0C3CII5_HEBCY|nr:hypothetical protein M413DRAFT_20923 [Hebeloma cylindrosporum h7]
MEEKDVPWTYSLSTPFIHLRNISGPFLYEFARWLNPGEIIEVVRISDSNISPPPIAPIPIFGHFLELNRIATSASVCAILGVFNTIRLKVTNCSGMNDSVLEYLAKDAAVPGISGKTSEMENMKQLEIVGSVNFSPLLLRRLIQLRAHVFSERIADETSRRTRGIVFLEVPGNCTDLSDDDIVWYRKNWEIVEVRWARKGGNRIELFSNFDD